MKYKFGDKVKIKSWADMEQEFGLTEYGHIKTSKAFLKEMKVYCDKVITIKKINVDYYLIKEFGYWWTDEMIDHKATKKLQRIIKKVNILKKIIPNPHLKSDRIFDMQYIILNDIIDNPENLTINNAKILNDMYRDFIT